MTTPPDTLEFEFKFKNDDENPATMILHVGSFKIRGFRVQKSKFDGKIPYYISPPANRGPKGWIQIVWVEDKSEWKRIEEKALTQFDKEHTEHLMKESITF
jgi:hypothetical protein